jgi:hypothetical protein
MQVEDFVAALRAQHVDALVDHYVRAFSASPARKVTDAGMRELREFWASSDDATRAVLAKFIRLGSQNTLSSVLAVLDNTSSQFAEKFLLTAKSPDGGTAQLSEDLLDTFWAQEEAAGHVNRRAT